MSILVIVAAPLLAAAVLRGARPGARAGIVIALTGLLTALLAVGRIALVLADPDARNVLVDRFGAAGINIEIAAWFAPGEVVSRFAARADAMALVAVTGLLAVGILATLSAASRGASTSELARGLTIVGVALAAILADDLLLVAACWQLASLAGRSVVSGRGSDNAGTMVSAAGNGALLLAVMMLAWEFGSFVPAEVAARAAAGWLGGQPQATAVSTLLVFAVMSRLAVMPLHGQLPRGARAAPPARLIEPFAQASLGVVILLRLHVVAVLGAASLALLTGLAAVTVLSAATTAAAARPGPRALAWAAVSQLALAAVGLGTGAFPNALLHVVGCGLVFAALHACGTGRVALRDDPRLATARFVAAAGWIGVPLLTPLAATREAILWRASFEPTGNVSLWWVLAAAGAFHSIAACRWLLEGDGHRPAARPAALVAAALATAAVLIAGSSGWFRIAARPGGGLATPFDSLEVREWTAAAAGPDWIFGRPGMFGVQLALVASGVLVGVMLPRIARLLDAERAPTLARLRELAASGWHADEALVTIARRLLAIPSRWTPSAPDRPPVEPSERGGGIWLGVLGAGLFGSVVFDDVRLIALGWAAAAAGASGALPVLGRAALGPTAVAIVLASVALAGLRGAAAGSTWSLTAMVGAGAQGSPTATPAWALLAALLVLAVVIPQRILASARRLAALVATGFWFGALIAAMRFLPRLFPAWWSANANAVALVAAFLTLAAASALGEPRRLGSTVAWLLAYFGGLTVIGLALWGPQGVLAAVLALVAGALAAAGVTLSSSGDGSARGRSAALFLAGPIAFTPAFLAFTVLLMAALARMPWLTPPLLAAGWLSVRSALRVAPAASRATRWTFPRAALVVAAFVTGVAPAPLIGVASEAVRSLLAAELRFDPADPELDPDGDRVAAVAESAAQMAQEEADVGRALGESAHEPGIPARPVADVDP